MHALGLQAAQGLVLTEAFYWDKDDQTRAWSQRFAKANGGKMPTMVQAGVYAGMLHYLKAVEAAKSKDSAAVVAKMKATPTDDALFGKGSIESNGRTIHDMYLYEVKKPSESKGPWDYYKLVSTIPGKDAFQRSPRAAATCRSEAHRRRLAPRGETAAVSTSSFPGLPRESRDREPLVFEMAGSSPAMTARETRPGSPRATRFFQ